MTSPHSKLKATVYVKPLALSAFWLWVLISFVYPIYQLTQVQQVDTSNPVVTPSVMPDFSKFDNIEQKKRAFFAYLTPEINRQNDLVLAERSFLLSINLKSLDGKNLTAANLSELKKLAIKYQLDPESDVTYLLDTLLNRVDIIPSALVLMQAANESAWGTSRFAVKGYNFFGLWCFRKGCGFVPKHRNEGAIHEVAKFRDLAHAVQTYLTNLNRHNAYKELRMIRKNLRSKNKAITAEALVHGLENYSERGQEYIDELLSMIRFNRKYM